MKENLVIIVLDSLSADEINDVRFGDSAMPFLHQLMKEGINVKNYYSQGSHTEAGLPGLICGEDSLDDNGYLHRFNDAPRTLFDYFHESGYDFYNFSWPRNYMPERINKYVKNYYTQSLIFSDLLFWELPYYKEVYEKGKLNEKDIIDIIKKYRESFEAALIFWNKDKNPDNAYKVVEKYIEGEDTSVILEEITHEYSNFKKNPRDYVMEDIKNGYLKRGLQKKHSKQEKSFDADKLKLIENKNSGFLKKLKIKQLEGVFINRSLNYGRLFIEAISKICGGKEHIYLTNWHSKILSVDRFNLCHMNRERADGFSLRKELRFLAEEILLRPTSKPKIVYFHSGSIHPPIDWFSFDESLDVICKEIEAAKELFKNTHNYHGDYVYRLGMKYMDMCLKDAFQYYEQKGILENTVFVITADHGSSIGSRPVRFQMNFNNCHSELHHVPMVIWGKGLMPQNIEGFYENKDFAPSILELFGIEKDIFLQGHSFFDKSYSAQIAHGERIGSGCACLEHRDVIYWARNDKYLIEYIVNVYQEFSEGKLTEVYDIEKDPDELHNVVNKIEKNEISELMTYLRNRHALLQLNYGMYCKNLNDSQED